MASLLRRFVLFSLSVALMSISLVLTTTPASATSGVGDTSSPAVVPAANIESVCDTPYPHWYTVGEGDKWAGIGFANCNPPNGKTARAWVDRMGVGLYSLCVPPGGQSGYVGFTRVLSANPWPPAPGSEPWLTGEVVNRNFSLYTSCPGGSGNPVPPPPDVCPECISVDVPWVDINGEVRTEVNAGEARRSLPNAHYALMYVDDAGTQHPVLDDVDAHGNPAGSPVTGFLDDRGGYAIRVPYPQPRTLGNGSHFDGCMTTDVPFMQSLACADDALVLVVSAYDEPGDVVVQDFHTGLIEIAATVPLGLYFQRLPDAEAFLSTNPAAYAYGAGYTMRERWPADRLTPVTYRLHDLIGSGYLPTTRYIDLSRGEADGPAPEHEVAHLLADRLYGNGFPWLECLNHTFGMPSDPHCAFQEGFAEFVGQVAENAYTHSSVSHLWDLESCQAVDDHGTPFLDCPDGPTVEGRVAAALWDLWDDSQDVRSGFVDDVTTDLNTLVAAIDQTEPTTIDEFIARWEPLRGPDRQIMFMNTLSYHDRIADAGTEGAMPINGDWGVKECPSCVGGSYLMSEAQFEGTMTWTTAGVLAAATYDVWVRLPPGEASMERFASYVIETTAGQEVVTVDQAAAQDGWVNLNTNGFKLPASDEIVVLLTNVRGVTGSLSADALLVAPHL
ncbi:hypothetical protein [Actinokineospora sp. HUAS TT18]|uniref:golvesin C-terminal-like domain-containing protein n=1 Tax=Actinokineospora sp. HUAS TT18 TaxID=3447451 RepID=UPI003F51D266